MNKHTIFGTSIGYESRVNNRRSATIFQSSDNQTNMTVDKVYQEACLLLWKYFKMRSFPFFQMFHSYDQFTADKKTQELQAASGVIGQLSVDKRWSLWVKELDNIFWEVSVEESERKIKIMLQLAGNFEVLMVINKFKG